MPIGEKLVSNIWIVCVGERNKSMVLGSYEMICWKGYSVFWNELYLSDLFTQICAFDVQIWLKC